LLHAGPICFRVGGKGTDQARTFYKHKLPFIRRIDTLVCVGCRSLALF
jgi:hypothetical protein